MPYKVSPEDLTDIKLNAADTVTSVIQNVAIILSTRRGDVPMGRDVGLTGDFIDMPMNAARTLILSEIHEALLTQEPRASLVKVTFEADGSEPGRLIPTVYFEVNDG